MNASNGQPSGVAAERDHWKARYEAAFAHEKELYALLAEIVGLLDDPTIQEYHADEIANWKERAEGLAVTNTAESNTGEAQERHEQMKRDQEATARYQTPGSPHGGWERARDWGD